MAHIIKPKQHQNKSLIRSKQDQVMKTKDRKKGTIVFYTTMDKLFSSTPSSRLKCLR